MSLPRPPTPALQQDPSFHRRQHLIPIGDCRAHELALRLGRAARCAASVKEAPLRLSVAGRKLAAARGAHI
jgi:hypothetical protein